MTAITTHDWRRLTEAIRRKKCILLVGPDIAPGPDDPEEFPLTLKLAHRLSQSLPQNIQPNNNDEFARVAQIVYNTSGMDRYDLELEVQDFYKPFVGHTTPLYQELAALPFALCLTTAQDHFLLNAFLQTSGKAPLHDFYHFRKNRPFQLSDATEERPLIYHLFGDLQALDSLVLTETDLLEFLVNVVRAAPALPPYIASQLSDPQTSFLFLGFGFQRWYTRVLLHILKTFGHRNRSLALEGTGFFSHPDREHTAIFFEQEHKIEFRQHSWTKFAEKLRKLHETEKSTIIEPALPADAPKVFLCHDSRDREHVIDVELRLHRSGINTWRDHQDLRGGEDWERRIPQVIRKQVDYMLVLQTPSMSELAKSFVHKEILEALEQQKLFDEDEIFLIPAILIQNPGLSRLHHLHQRDLTDSHGVERLAAEIQNDFKRRRTRVVKS